MIFSALSISASPFEKREVGAEDCDVSGAEVVDDVFAGVSPLAGAVAVVVVAGSRGC